MENTNSSVGLQMYLQVRVKIYRQMYRQVIATGDCGGQNQWRLSSAIRIWGVRSKEPINVPLKPPFMRFQFQWSLWDWRVSNMETQFEFGLWNDSILSKSLCQSKTQRKGCKKEREKSGFCFFRPTSKMDNNLFYFAPFDISAIVCCWVFVLQ